MLKGLAADRAVLRIGGADARDFLQDLVSNDVDRAGEGAAVYAALLTPQGKYLFDFFVLRDGDSFLLDVAAARAQALAQRLAMYRLRREATIAPAGLSAALCWGDEAPPAPEGAIPVPDPREKRLGWRLYAPDAAAALAAAGAAPADRAAYDALRVALAIPESGVELIPEDTYILEAGFERLNGVDFHKGCYVGQEIVARMKHKAELRKGLARVAVEGEAPPPGTAIETEDGRPAGTLFTTAGGEGLAHLRFDRAKGEMRAGAARLRRID